MPLFNYPFVWLLILTMTFYLYLIEDGSALGMSITLPWLSKKTQRKALSLLLPVWDINQTWLVFTLAGLYGGFSLGFVLVIQQLYLPTWLLVIFFICRGAAIEYAIKDQDGPWLFALAGFSLMIILLQGYIIYSLTDIVLNSYSLNFLPIWTQLLFGIFTFLLFDLQLGLQFLSIEIPRRIHSLLLFTFILFFLLFITCYQPLNVSLEQYIYQPFFIITLILFFSIMIISLHSRKNFYGATLKLFALLNLATIEYLAFPKVFPANTSYLTASSNSNSLLIMIVISMIVLPIIIIVTRSFKTYFREKMNDIYY